MAPRMTSEWPNIFQRLPSLSKRTFLMKFMQTMAVTIIFYSNLPLGIIMYHLQAEIIALPNYPIWGT